MKRLTMQATVTLSVLAENEDHANRLVFEAMSQTKGIQPKKRRRRKGQAEDAAPLESPEVSVVGVSVSSVGTVKVSLKNDWDPSGFMTLNGVVAKTYDINASEPVKDVMEPDASA